MSINILILLASLEFQHAIPSQVLNTTALLKTNIAQTLAIPANTIKISNMYYSVYKNMYYQLTSAAPYSINSTVNIQYNIIDPSQSILNMGLIQFNTIMAKSSYIIDYSKSVGGSDNIIAAGPIELLHLPSPQPYKTSRQQSSAPKYTIISIYKCLILYILMTAAHIQQVN